VNHEAIYDTTASPFKRLSWGRCTKKVNASGATLYLHVFQWPNDGKLLVPGLKNSAEKAWLLADAKETGLALEPGPEGLTITLPPTASDPIASTVALKVKGALDIQSSALGQDYDGSLLLPSAEARLHGDQIKYEDGDQHDNIGYWLSPDEWVDWVFNATKTGKFEVSAEIAGLDSAAFEASLGEQKLKTTVEATGDYSKFRRVRIGTLEITSTGQLTFSVRPVKEGWHPINLRSVRFKPAK